MSKQNDQITNKIMTRQGVVLESDITSGMSFLYCSIFGRAILKILVQPFVSKIAGMCLSTRLSTLLIPRFIKKNHINMEEYKEVQYHSFNEFFSREIKDERRPFSKNPCDLVSPADSKLSIYAIEDHENCILNVKKSQYQLSDIVGDQQIAKQYQGGYALVFRLSVDDYHRYMALDEGEVLKHSIIKGIFHTVNPIATYDYPIYSQNAREVTMYQTKNFGKVTYIEVGAMMVGKIVNLKQKHINRGQIKGYFQFGGSTVVCLFEKNSIQIDSDLLEYCESGYEVKIKMGETIGRSI